MEDVDTLTHLINTVGFPIVVCLILFWFIKTYLNKIIVTLDNVNVNLVKHMNSLDNLTNELKNRNNNNV